MSLPGIDSEEKPHSYPFLTGDTLRYAEISKLGLKKNNRTLMFLCLILLQKLCRRYLRQRDEEEFPELRDALEKEVEKVVF